MKRIDKYSLEECRDKYLKYMETDAYMKSNIEEFVEYCNEEIKKVPRIATINTAEDFEKAEIELSKICKNIPSCKNCRFFNAEKTCVSMYVAEKIEVE